MNSIYELETVSAMTKCRENEPRFTAITARKQASERAWYTRTAATPIKRIRIRSFYWPLYRAHIFCERIASPPAFDEVIREHPGLETRLRRRHQRIEAICSEPSRYPDFAFRRAAIQQTPFVPAPGESLENQAVLRLEIARHPGNAGASRVGM
jgi:hypothetical protein